VFHVDVTSVQLLVDARNQLDRHTAPRSVQWHFACIHSRWTKRALAAAGFGFPSQDAADGQARQWKSVFSVAEISSDGLDGKMLDDDRRLTKDIEMADWSGEQECVDQRFAKVLESVTLPSKSVDRTAAEDRISFDKSVTVMTESVPVRDSNGPKAALHGINRPFFHADLKIALHCAVENAQMAGLDSPS
jgi:sodium-independent sulfate anion transporter 11